MVLKKVFFILSCSALLVSCSGNKQNEIESEENGTEEVSAEELFLVNCATCHGKDGKLGISGASDLSKSKLTDIELTTVIAHGRKGMPPMQDLLKTEENVSAVAEYVKKLRK